MNKYSLFDKLFIVVGVLFLTPFLYLARPFPLSRKLKVSYYITSRIGHYAFDFLYDYAQVQSSNQRQIKLIYLDKPTSNSFIDTLVSRVFVTGYLANVAYIATSRLPLLDSYLVKPKAHTETGSRDLSGLLNKYEKPALMVKEENEVINRLIDLGWKKGVQPLVCLNVRDSKYLEIKNKNNKNSREITMYHAHRDSEVNNYIEAVNWLINAKGAFVLRTGLEANKRIDLVSPSIVDLPYVPFFKNRSMFDYWIFSNCDLMISTGSGPDIISQSYDVPTILLNFCNMSVPATFSNCMIAPKRLTWRQNNKQLTLEEYIRFDSHDNFKFTSSGINISDIPSQQVLSKVQEGWNVFIEDNSIPEKYRNQTNHYLKILNNLNKQPDPITQRNFFVAFD